jgi:hypothetical protein
MPHQSDAFEELDACDDVRESSYHRDRKNELYPIFKGQNKQRIEQYNLGYQSREQKKRGESNHIRINLTQTEPTPEQFTERKEASVFGWTVSAFSPHKTDNTHTQNNALLLLKRETGGSSIEQRGIWRGAAETGRSKHTQREKVPLFL